MDRFPRSDSIVQSRSGLQTYMAQVYGWMTVGLLLTAFIAWFAANTPAVMMFVFSSKNHFLRADHRPTGAGVCALGDGAALKRGYGDDAVYALFGVNRANVSEHLYCLYLFVYRQHFCGDRRDVRGDEPVWVHD